MQSFVYLFSIDLYANQIIILFHNLICEAFKIQLHVLACVLLLTSPWDLLTHKIHLIKLFYVNFFIIWILFAANGTCRSEGVVSFFLQRATDAKRNYATLVGMQAECLGPRACSLPRFDSLVEETIRNFYKNNKIDPNDIAYLELDGSGIKVIFTIH